MRVIGARVTVALVLAGSIFGLGHAQEGKDRKAEVDAAKAQIAVLGKAVDTYHVKLGEYPMDLKALVEKKLVQPDALIDPWKKEYQYDVTGKHNGGKTPDIWTVTPNKVTIGNWVEKKK